MRDIAAAVGRWSDAPDISARSVLVTVLGDSVLPVTKTVWLSSLFELARPFGFSERLVRTSLFRLAAEDWVSNERVGRRSRYSLTRLAVSEFEDADRRIYSHTPFEWDGWWTIAIVDSPLTPAAERERIIRHLRWHGFVALGRGLLASPSVMPQSLHQLLELIEFSGVVPAGRAELGDVDGLVANGFFAEAFRTSETESAYRSFIERYRPWHDGGLDGSIDPLDAFALRTMLIHDLRKIRLRSPDMPRQLLPPDWVGNEAYGLAADLYRRLEAAAALALSRILQVDYPSRMPHRFEG